jgi:hypothetical protein
MLYWGCKSTREEMQMAQVKITWKAFGDKPEIGRFISSVEFETEFKIDETNVDKFLEVVYHNTNTYSGNLWQIIEPLLSETRTHTSISVGDEIEIDGQVYICADFGFEKIEDVEIKYYGDAVFRVVKKDKVDN